MDFIHFMIAQYPIVWKHHMLTPPAVHQLRATLSSEGQDTDGEEWGRHFPRTWVVLGVLGVPATTAPLLKEPHPPTPAHKVDLPGQV